MARKPIPSHLKVLKGTDQPCRMNKDEPKPKADNIRMPDGLSDDAKKQWSKVSKQLKEAGIITNLDVHALALYCEAFARWKDANAKISKFGAVIKSPKGYPMTSPYFSISNKAFEQMKAILTEFGMTPSSRTRVASTKATKNDDPWENI